MSYIDPDRYAEVRRLVPIACVDLLCSFAERVERGKPDLLLIERVDGHGEQGRLALVGGRIHRDETIEAAALRHLEDAVGPGVGLEPREWGRPDWAAVYPHADSGPGPFDPRQHAISLTYRVRCSGAPELREGGEADGLVWFEAADPPPAERFGFGQGAVLAELLSASA